MIYLTFDSNIWIYLLDESWKEDNALDYLEHWIAENYIKILLPKIILKEWENNKEREKKVREKKLRDFFSMAGEIFPFSLGDYNNPEKQAEFIDVQFTRIENILRTNIVEIDISLSVQAQTIERSINKNAPMHKNKNSVADTLIILSLLEFANQNKHDEYIFLSENVEDFFEIEIKKDIKPQDIIGLWENYKKELVDHNTLDAAMNNFFEKNYKIHTDLKGDFSKFNLKSFRRLKPLIDHLKSRLPITVSLAQLREDRKNKLAKEITFNPEHEKLVKDLPKENYIENISHLDIILKKKIPTQQEAKFTFALIDSDTSYKEYFFKKIESVVWFTILKQKGTFNPVNNPAPVQVNVGFQIPFWEPLIYLEKLSLQIKNGQLPELIDEIISIINHVSQNPVDNYKTWYWFIKILNNLPNEKISLETLNFIPVWLKGSFDTMLQSSEICENLLPKFLAENPTNDDIEKAELILRFLFSLEKIEVTKEGGLGFDIESYRSRVEMHILSDVFVNQKLTSKIIAHCSDNVIIDLAEKIKTLRFDFPRGINFPLKIKSKHYRCKAEIETENLNIEISEKENEEKTIGRTKIERFESLDDKQIESFFINFLKGLGLEYEKYMDDEYGLEILTNALTNGSYYPFYDDTISTLNDRHDQVVDIFSLIFRDLLNDKVKQNKNSGISLLKLFAFENKYRLTFFRRVVLFVINDNWEACKNVFWEILQDNDPMLIFSTHSFEKDLYELLNKNQIMLSQEEIIVLQKIIDLGPQGKSKDQDPEYQAYWRLRWYSALRDIAPFKDRYQKLSQAENLTNEHYENLGKVRTRWGSDSPFSVEEILQKSNREIVQFIHSFKPKDRWEEPTIDGLSNALQKAVENEPRKFSDEIELFKDVYYIYAYHITIGFREAWKNKKSFNWEKVLNFYKEYISNEKFTSGQFYLENDEWGVTADWVTGSIGNLLIDGMQSDSNAFDLALLPLVKDTLQIIVPRLKPVEDFKQTNMNYPTYSLNSTAGKIIRALLDYSLRRARNLKAEEKQPKWEQEIKDLLEETLKKGIIDGYILTGWYFQQFYFLDKYWITSKVKDYYQLEDKQWLAFMSGFTFGNPPFNKDIYQLFFPHYERAIKNDIQMKSFSDRGIIRHIAAYYFWGFEDLQTNGLLVMLINKGHHAEILELVNFIWRQDGYLKNLNHEETKNFEVIIFKLWSYLANKYDNATNEEEQKVLTGLSNLLVFAPELNDSYSDLMLKSIGITSKHFHSHNLLENLTKLVDRGNQKESAKHVGLILNSIQFSHYFSSIDKQLIISLVTFLYENEQRQIANEFCNKMAKQGHEFLIDVHNKYME